MNVCVGCGVTSQRGGKSWDLWNQCANCAKRTNPDYYNVLKCVECGSTSNNITAICWKLYNKCGKCAYKKPDHTNHTLCPDCNIVVMKLRYNRFGSKAIKLFYCIQCAGIISERGVKVFSMSGIKV